MSLVAGSSDPSTPVVVPSDAPSLELRVDDGVTVIVVPKDLAFEAVRDFFRAAVPTHRAELAGRSVRMDLGDREIKLFDLRRLLHLLKDEMGVEVTGLYVRREEVHRYAERELKLRLFYGTDAAPSADPVTAEEPTDEIPDDLVPDVAEAAIVSPAELDDEDDVEEIEVTPADEVQAPEPARAAEPEPGRRTLTLGKTLRSGASVKFDGDVVLFGDVNPGAQIVAAGNVLVLGAVKGVVHAGATGDEGAFILGFEMRPTQLRIGRRIAIPPERAANARPEVEIAHVLDGQIVIQPYQGRLPVTGFNGPVPGLTGPLPA